MDSTPSSVDHHAYHWYMSAGPALRNTSLGIVLNGNVIRATAFKRQQRSFESKTLHLPRTEHGMKAMSSLQQNAHDLLHTVGRRSVRCQAFRWRNKESTIKGTTFVIARLEPSQEDTRVREERYPV